MQAVKGSSKLGKSQRDHPSSASGSQRSSVSQRPPLPPPLPLMLPFIGTHEPTSDSAHSTPPLRIGFRPPSRTSTRQGAKAKSKGVAHLDLNTKASQPTLQSPSRRFRSLTRKAALADLRLRKSGSTSSARSTGFCLNTTPIPPPTIPPTPVSPSSPASPLLTPHLSLASKRLKSKSQKLLRKFSVPVWKLRGNGRLFGGRSFGHSPTTAPSDEDYHGQSTAEDTSNLVAFYQMQSMPCREFLSSPRYVQSGSIGPGSSRTSTPGGDALALGKTGLRKSQSLQDLMRTCAPRREVMTDPHDDRSSALRGTSNRVKAKCANANEEPLPRASEGTQTSLSASVSCINSASRGERAHHDSENMHNGDPYQSQSAGHCTSSSSLSYDAELHSASMPARSSHRETHFTNGAGLPESYASQTTLTRPQAKQHPYNRMHQQHGGHKSSDDDPHSPVATSPVTSSTPAMMEQRQYQSTRAQRHGMLSSVTIQDAFAYDDVGRSTPNILGSPSRASSTLSPTRTSCSRGVSGAVVASKDSRQHSNHSSILSLDADYAPSAAKTAHEEMRIREQILAACARQEEYMQSFQQEYARMGASPRSTARGTASDLSLAPHRISTVVSSSSEALLAIDLLDLRPERGTEQAGHDGQGMPVPAIEQNTAHGHGNSSMAERQRKASVGQLFGASQPFVRPARSPRLPPMSQLSPDGSAAPELPSRAVGRLMRRVSRGG